MQNLNEEVLICEAGNEVETGRAMTVVAIAVQFPRSGTKKNKHFYNTRN